MKLALRTVPEDFQVSEEIGLACCDGPYALYRIRKVGVGTPELLAALSKRWGVRPERIAWAGLKDRHAVATQYITILHGPRRSLQQARISVEYVGQTDRAIRPDDILANTFRIVVRKLTRRRADELRRRLEQAAARGWPNYFDEQRFGSLGFPDAFVAEAWCLGQYERALWLALAAAYRHDTSRERMEKQWLRLAWGRWDELSGLSHPIRRRVVRYLAEHPGDYRHAFALIPVTLRRIYLSAFQSYLWNALASCWLEHRLEGQPVRWLEVAGQSLAVPDWQAELPAAGDLATAIPLPSARSWPSEPWLEAKLDELLKLRGLERRQLRVKYPRDSFFSRTERAVWVKPVSFDQHVEPDQLHAGRRALVVDCQLPRGAFATLVLRYASMEDSGTSPAQEKTLPVSPTATSNGP
ncbi:MAG: tRNA pseudouridine synthase D [Pirellulaceae bacterium]|nr:MAG: tRNA pseudouridine synthase D [Pirellulaceae bacterium]